MKEERDEQEGMQVPSSLDFVEYIQSQSLTELHPSPACSPAPVLGGFWSVWCVYNKSTTAQLNYSKQHKEYVENMQNSAYMI